MARTFGLDVWACPRRGGRFQLIPSEEASAIDRIQRHLGLSTEVPPPRPATEATMALMAATIVGP